MGDDWAAGIPRCKDLRARWVLGCAYHLGTVEPIKHLWEPICLTDVDVNAAAEVMMGNVAGAEIQESVGVYKLVRSMVGPSAVVLHEELRGRVPGGFLEKVHTGLDGDVLCGRSRIGNEGAQAHRPYVTMSQEVFDAIKGERWDGAELGPAPGLAQYPMAYLLMTGRVGEAASLKAAVESHSAGHWELGALDVLFRAGSGELSEDFVLEVDKLLNYLPTIQIFAEINGHGHKKWGHDRDTVEFRYGWHDRGWLIFNLCKGIRTGESGYMPAGGSRRVPGPRDGDWRAFILWDVIKRAGLIDNHCRYPGLPDKGWPEYCDYMDRLG